MKFLRTASTTRLLATLAALVAVIAAGSAIAVGATSGGPVPKAKPLAAALRTALTAKQVKGISARITFTNGLISTADFTGDAKDPILQGASGRLWIGDHQMRLELQSDNGDAQIVVNGQRFWISDPAMKTVYEGALPKDSSSASARSKGKKAMAADRVPSVASIQKELTGLMAHLTFADSRTSDPTDVAGRPAYSIKISPKHSGGLLGAAQVAWDSVTGVPLNIAIYARGNSSPVLQIEASDISYGSVPASDFTVSPASGYKVVKLATASSAAHPANKRATKQKEISGVSAVASHLSFKLAAPSSVVGLRRQETKLLSMGGSPAALVTYGQGLGAVVVVEHAAKANGKGTPSQPSSSSSGNLSLPTVSINGTSAQELATALGTVLEFQRGGVAYTVIGSVPPYVAEKAAEAVAAG